VRLVEERKICRDVVSKRGCYRISFSLRWPCTIAWSMVELIFRF